MVQFCECDDTIRGGAAHEVMRAQLARVIKTRGRDQFRKRLDRLAVKICHAHRLVGNDDRALDRAQTKTPRDDLADQIPRWTVTILAVE